MVSLQKMDALAIIRCDVVLAMSDQFYLDLFSNCLALREIPVVQVNVFNLVHSLVTGLMVSLRRHDKGHAVRCKDSIKVFMKLRAILFDSTRM
jgi:hypothetical protein